MKLTNIPLPPETYWHVFRKSDGSLFETETTKQDYKQLAGPGHIDPTNPNGTWLNSYSGKKIPLGTYAEMSAGVFLANVDGLQISVKEDGIVNDELTAEAIIELKGQGFLKTL